MKKVNPEYTNGNGAECCIRRFRRTARILAIMCKEAVKNKKLTMSKESQLTFNLIGKRNAKIARNGTRVFLVKKDGTKVYKFNRS